MISKNSPIVFVATQFLSFIKVLLITETPPNSPNGFGVTLKCLFKEIPHDVIYTDSSYKDLGDELGFKLAHLPYHRGKYVLAFLGKLSGEVYTTLWLKGIAPNDSPCLCFLFNMLHEVCTLGFEKKFTISYPSS